MNRPLITIHNLETNEIIEREMNDEEFADFQNNLLKNEQEQIAFLSKINERKNLLEKLGLTEEEAKLLLG